MFLYFAKLGDSTLCALILQLKCQVHWIQLLVNMWTWCRSRIRSNNPWAHCSLPWRREESFGPLRGYILLSVDFQKFWPTCSKIWTPSTFGAATDAGKDAAYDCTTAKENKCEAQIVHCGPATVFHTLWRWIQYWRLYCWNDGCRMVWVPD